MSLEEVLYDFGGCIVLAGDVQGRISIGCAKGFRAEDGMDWISPFLDEG